VTAAELDERREALYDAPCYVIDFLPRQVPAEGGGRYLAVERTFRTRPRLDGLYERFARVVLCLLCYYDIAASRLPEDEWIPEPSPETLSGLVTGCAEENGRYLTLLFPAEDVLLTLDGGDLYMTLYNPPAEFLETVAALASAEGLFVRRGAE